MSERARLALLIAIMAAIAVISSVAAGVLLYRTAFEEERARLREMVQIEARLIEAVSRFAAVYSAFDDPQGGADATFRQIAEAHRAYERSDGSREFVLASLGGNQIKFLLREGLHGVENPPESIPMDAQWAEPMRRALAGQSGTVVGLDYRGATVLAAYEPVATLNWGVVAKLDLEEIRAPFIRAGAFAMLVIAALTVAGATLFHRLFNPIVRRLENSVGALATAQRIAQLGNWNWDTKKDVIQCSDETRRILGLSPSPIDATYDGFLDKVHPDDRRRFEEAIARCVADRTPYAIDYRIVQPDGTERFVHGEGEMVLDNSGNPAQLGGQRGTDGECGGADGAGGQVGGDVERTAEDASQLLDAAVPGLQGQ